MKPKAKQFLSNFFFGLFSNDHAMQGAKTFPWWVCLIIALFAVIFPIIPITVSQAKTYGASFLSNYTYRFDQNIAKATVSLASENKDFKVEHQSLIYYDGENHVAEVTVENDETPVYQHVSDYSHQYELLVYFTYREKADLTSYISNISNTTYQKGSTDKVTEGYEGDKYAPTFVVLASTGIYTRINKDDSTEVGNNTYTSYASDWKHFEEGTCLIKGALPKDKAVADIDLNKSSQVKEIFDNWKEYYNKSYISQKTFNTWMTSLLFLGIYAALVFIMGLLVFLLTRGKNNMFNYLKFIDTQKIVWWASLAPGLLAMILGFIISSFAQMMFIILLGLRVMWISMKQLRPQQ